MKNKEITGSLFFDARAGWILFSNAFQWNENQVVFLTDTHKSSIIFNNYTPAKKIQIIPEWIFANFGKYAPLAQGVIYERSAKIGAAPIPASTAETNPKGLT